MQVLTRLNRCVLELCVLALIAGKEVYGYDLIQKLKIYGLTVTVGTVYPVLSQLRKDGYIVSEVKDSTVGPSRRYYELTDKGIDFLNAGVTDFSQFSKSIGQLLNKIFTKQ